MGLGVSNTEILETLRRLRAGLSVPVWLFGGVAVDFLVGRWTRPHGDIDLHAYNDTRERLTRELNTLGFQTSNTGWLTHWASGDKAWRLEVVFLERSQDHDSGVLVIRDDDVVGVQGRYAMPPGYLDLNRWATVEGLTFRVCSPSGEWLARATAARIVPGRPPDTKIEHDMRLLEGLLDPNELEALRVDVARRR